MQDRSQNRKQLRERASETGIGLLLCLLLKAKPHKHGRNSMKLGKALPESSKVSHPERAHGEALFRPARWRELGVLSGEYSVETPEGSCLGNRDK